MSASTTPAQPQVIGRMNAVYAREIALKEYELSRSLNMQLNDYESKPGKSKPTDVGNSPVKSKDKKIDKKVDKKNEKKISITSLFKTSPSPKPTSASISALSSPKKIVNKSPVCISEQQLYDKRVPMSPSNGSTKTPRSFTVPSHFQSLSESPLFKHQQQQRQEHQERKNYDLPLSLSQVGGIDINNSTSPRPVSLNINRRSTSYFTGDSGCLQDYKAVFPDKAEAVKGYRARNDRELSLRAGDIVSGLQQSALPNWLYGRVEGETGLFPAEYVELLMRVPGQRDMKSLNYDEVLLLLDNAKPKSIPTTNRIPESISSRLPVRLQDKLNNTTTIRSISVPTNKLGPGKLDLAGHVSRSSPAKRNISASFKTPVHVKHEPSRALPQTSPKDNTINDSDDSLDDFDEYVKLFEANKKQTAQPEIKPIDDDDKEEFSSKVESEVDSDNNEDYGFAEQIYQDNSELDDYTVDGEQGEEALYYDSECDFREDDEDDEGDHLIYASVDSFEIITYD